MSGGRDTGFVIYPGSAGSHPEGRKILVCLYNRLVNTEEHNIILCCISIFAVEFRYIIKIRAPVSMGLPPFLVEITYTFNV